MNGRTIVVAVDGSPAAEAAVGRALELALALRAPLRFIHGDERLAKDLYDENPEGPTPEQVAAADPVLADCAGRALAENVPAQLDLVGESSAVELAAAIAGIASGSGAGMIVTGSRGRGPAAGAVLGSVSHNLIAHSPVPVLVVLASDPDASPDGFRHGEA